MDYGIHDWCVISLTKHIPSKQKLNIAYRVVESSDYMSMVGDGYNAYYPSPVIG